MALRFWILTCLLACSLSLINAETRLCVPESSKSLCDALNSFGDVRCIAVANDAECTLQLQAQNATFGRLAGDSAILARALTTNDDLQVVARIRPVNAPFNAVNKAELVAVVRAGYTGGVTALKGKKYCHPGFNRDRYWTDAVWQSFERELNKSAACVENTTSIEFRTASLSAFFSAACRPGPWTADKKLDESLKKAYPNLCSLCDFPKNCSSASDFHLDTTPAMKCMQSKKADVAVLFKEDLLSLFNVNNPTLPTPGINLFNITNYRLLCPDSSVRPITDITTVSCSWLVQPLPIVVAHKSASSEVIRLLKDDRPTQWKGIVKLPDEIMDVLEPTPSLQSYISSDRITQQPDTSCHPSIRVCVYNEVQQRKCNLLKYAAQTHGLYPSLTCVSSITPFDCFEKVNTSQADIVSVPTNLGFIARHVKQLEHLSYIEDSEKNIGVVVVKNITDIKRFKDLNNKRACFPSFNGFGYLSFLDGAYQQSLIKKSSCSLSDETLRLFSSACAPGALDATRSIEPPPQNTTLCSLCSSGSSSASCSADDSNGFYGDIGALRCLDQAGDYASVEYHAFRNFMDSGKTDQDSGITDDKIKILCTNGSLVSKIDLLRKDDLEYCTQLRVIKQEVLTRKGQNQKRIADMRRLIKELDDWFGINSHYTNIVSLYGTFLNQKDVIFPTAGVSIAKADYVGVEDYVEFQDRVKHCSAGSKLMVSIAICLCSIIAVAFNL